MEVSLMGAQVNKTLLSEYKTISWTFIQNKLKLPNVSLVAANLNRVGNNPRKIGVIVVNSRIYISYFSHRPLYRR